MKTHLPVLGQDAGSASDVCARCTRNCCSRHLPIFLTPSEEELFPDDGHGLRVTRGPASSVVELSETCLHLDATNRCGVYPERPLDCRLYPLYFGGSADSPALLIDARCPQSYVVEGREMRARGETLLARYRAEGLIGAYIVFLGSSHGNAEGDAVTLMNYEEFASYLILEGSRGLCSRLASQGAVPADDRTNIEAVLAAIEAERAGAEG